MEPQHGLSQNVCGRVPDDLAPPLVGAGDELNLGFGFRDRGEVAHLALGHECDRSLYSSLLGERKAVFAAVTS
jgi:hypothetical protein